MAALRDEAPLSGDEHPFAIVLQTPRAEARHRKIDDPPRFDRVDVQ